MIYKDLVDIVVVELNKKVKFKKGIWGIYGIKIYVLFKVIVYYGCKVVGEILRVEDGGRILFVVDGEIL